MVLNIKPIRNEIDYNEALKKVDELIDAEEGTVEFDELDIVSTLIEKYEEEHYPIDPPDPVEAIKFRMEQLGLTRKDLEPYIGDKGKISDIFNKKRPLSIRMIRNLYNHLHIPAEILIQEYIKH